ncbi:MAG: hypothetical protein KTR31_40420 [Myxococcales bacterium]|nr:hypothetical protein [Myxococcales bacterium]
MRWIPLSLMLACSGGKDTTDETTPTGSTGDTGTTGTDGVLAIENANNFTYLGSWSLDSQVIGEELPVTVNWNDLSQDAWGAARAPSSYDRVLLLKIDNPATSVETRLETLDLHGTPPGILGRWEIEGNNLFQVSLTTLLDGTKTPFDPKFELLESTTETWLFALADETDGRLEIRAAVILEPTFKETNAQVAMRVGDSEASFEAVFNGDPVSIMGSQSDYSADWSMLTATAQGVSFDPDAGQELFIGHWAAGEPITQLENLVHVLGNTTQRFWIQDVAGRTTASLDVSADRNGQPFPGFTAGGTWMVGVRCPDCFSPAPLWAVEIDVQ